MAGGSDLLSQIKNKIEKLIPEYVVDISGLGLSYIRYDNSDGLRIGATTSISELLLDRNIFERYTVLSEAASSVATPQIRNSGTIAGDILQQVWCWYVRYNYPCWRNGGIICFGAIGDNRYYHSIFGGRLCYAQHASDLAPALLALDAEVKLISPGGERTVRIEQLLPGISIVDDRVKENVVHYNELLTEVHIPTLSSSVKSTYYKVRVRGVWDFGLASAAIRARFDGETITEARVVLGSVDVVPRRARSAEQFLVGKQLTEANIVQTAELALEGADPLKTGTGNAFRVEIAKGAVKKALRQLSD
jgi:xanthine dehydrogenase YagS FAD-binding subunit